MTTKKEMESVSLRVEDELDLLMTVDSSTTAYPVSFTLVDARKSKTHKVKEYLPDAFNLKRKGVIEYSLLNVPKGDYVIHFTQSLKTQSGCETFYTIDLYAGLSSSFQD